MSLIYILSQTATDFFKLLQNTNIDVLQILNHYRWRVVDDFLIVITDTSTLLSVSIMIIVFFTGLGLGNVHLTRKGLYIIFSFALAVLVSFTLKYAINESRPFISHPFIEKLADAGSPSFPSGHTTEVFVIAMALWIAFGRKISVMAVFVWALLVAYSRMALGVHYPLDVLAGILIGVSCAYFCFRFFQKWWIWIPA